jgi:hypothetical protein
MQNHKHNRRIIPVMFLNSPFYTCSSLFKKSRLMLGASDGLSTYKIIWLLL